MRHFIVRRYFQDFEGNPSGHLDIIGAFTSLLFWILMPSGRYILTTSTSLTTYQYDIYTKSFYINGSLIKEGVTLEEAQELVLADPAMKNEGIHCNSNFTAKDILSEIIIL